MSTAIERAAAEAFPYEHVGYTQPAPENCGCDECHLTGMQRIAFIEGAEYASTPRPCGGCQGETTHSPYCSTQPGAVMRQLARTAESLGDGIGANAPHLANQAYSIATALKARADRAVAR